MNNLEIVEHLKDLIEVIENSELEKPEQLFADDLVKSLLSDDYRLFKAYEPTRDISPRDIHELMERHEKLLILGLST